MKLSDSRIRTIVFEGPNRAGKTTIIEGMRQNLFMQSNSTTLKVAPPVTARQALESHWSIMHSLRLAERLDKSGTNDPLIMYVDRLPFPSDMIYRPAMGGGKSVDLMKHLDAVVDTLSEFNVIYIYVTASTEVLKERFLATGTHHHMGNGQDIDKIVDAYEEFFAHRMSGIAPGVPVLRLDSSHFPPEVLTRQAINWAAEQYGMEGVKV